MLNEGAISSEIINDIDLKPKAVDEGQIKLCSGCIQKRISSNCGHWAGVKVEVKNQFFSKMT